ncbi:MAG TPA: hypothetical protein VJB38_03180, partial [Bacteroidota bacterium]|nr:hypothetical protein [Bacteroidota bacterium]
MNIDMETKKSSIELGVSAPGAAPVQSRPEMLVVEASSKPFMSFVWVAAIFLLGGVGLALFQNSLSAVRPILLRKTNGQRGESGSKTKKEATLIEQA